MEIELKELWSLWWSFKKKKKPSRAFLEFEYHLEENLMELLKDLANGTYKHGAYKHVVLNKKKRRDLALAPIRDRLVHRLIYEKLVQALDSTFDFDVWSCRKGKGLSACLERAMDFVSKNRHGFFWKGDIVKFYANVDKEKLKILIARRISEPVFLKIVHEVIDSFDQGIPLGNLSSQIFSNIYLHEWDRFVRHTLKPKAYLRYGDDFVLFCDSEETAQKAKIEGAQFLAKRLSMQLNGKSEKIGKVKWGLPFLVRTIHPKAAMLTSRLPSNVGAAWALVRSQAEGKTRQKFMNAFAWDLLVSHPTFQ